MSSLIAEADQFFAGAEDMVGRMTESQINILRERLRSKAESDDFFEHAIATLAVSGLISATLSIWRMKTEGE